MKFKPDVNVNVNIIIKPLDHLIEKTVSAKINKNAPECYAKITAKELEKIYNYVIDNFSQYKTGNFSKEIICSIRASLIRAHMLYTHLSIQKNQDNILRDYNNNTSIKTMVKKYDGSPLNLLRIIFKKMYNEKLTSIIKNISILKPRDKVELDWAISHDAYALINDDDILRRANEFEEKIGRVLDILGVKYKTQNDLAQEQIEQNGIASNTPDFLILSNLIINGIKINWIDAKNFYGSECKLMKKRLESQTKKYINKWGYGSVIFSLGFSSKLKFENILLIDYDSFKNLV